MARARTQSESQHSGVRSLFPSNSKLPGSLSFFFWSKLCVLCVYHQKMKTWNFSSPIFQRTIIFFSQENRMMFESKSTFLASNYFSAASPPIMSPKDQTSHGRSLFLAVEPPEKQAPLLNPPKNAPSTSRAPPRRVDHTYRDVSQFSSDKPHSNKKASANFPAKLHKILSTPEFSHVSHYATYWSQLLNFIEEGESCNCLLTHFCLILSISSTYLISSDYFLDGEIHFLFSLYGALP